MKLKNLAIVSLFLLFFSGCIVFSFYPLYTEKDLFANELLTGEWIDKDSAIWKFEHSYNGKKTPENINRTAYYLTLKEKGQAGFSKASLLVHPVKLGGHYFLDFYLEEYFDDDNLSLFDFHVLPVHTFAKLELVKDSMYIHWFDQDWLKDLIKENRIRIHHEDNGNHILLTAKPQELQKFVIKYVNSAEAFEDGLDAALRKTGK
ncbi:MAG: hypothetical protein A2W90_14815 [Bacteroidetes bacterium GWF2_42_66]|nr:MAG: hypothetical protein A2W92_10980 [Bacteroidetes bacterium GWA2_42_15]OFX98964.1 MAG: hypothetical protein A2W89_06400 [Bacteroidetes bacterium GWE2_42_39]OFY46033.1 MAG: hypothetical protein A2W90_14815 [Bacteroidetes bacterium GWF2_42_66]HBL77197.1 hypothetical protein [Prolixibacteraceae bacterium]HCR90044.1 hypothetical protein [Prolixibacteraceae bacterium]